MRRNIQCDRKSEIFFAIFFELNKAITHLDRYSLRIGFRCRLEQRYSL